MGTIFGDFDAIFCYLSVDTCGMFLFWCDSFFDRQLSDDKSYFKHAINRFDLVFFWHNFWYNF